MSEVKTENLEITRDQDVDSENRELPKELKDQVNEFIDNKLKEFSEPELAKAFSYALIEVMKKRAEEKRVVHGAALFIYTEMVQLPVGLAMGNTYLDSFAPPYILGTMVDSLFQQSPEAEAEFARMRLQRAHANNEFLMAEAATEHSN